MVCTNNINLLNLSNFELVTCKWHPINNRFLGYFKFLCFLYFILFYNYDILNAFWSTRAWLIIKKLFLPTCLWPRLILTVKWPLIIIFLALFVWHLHSLIKTNFLASAIVIYIAGGLYGFSLAYHFNFWGLGSFEWRNLLYLFFLIVRVDFAGGCAG